MRNEPGSSSRDGQPIRVDAPDHAVIPGDVEMQSEEFEVGANDENSNFQRVPDHPSDENPHVEPQSPQSSEPRLPHPRRRITSQQFQRNVSARQSTLSFHPVSSSEVVIFFVKILDDFHDFVSELCLFPEENQQPVLGGNRFSLRKVTIFIGRETKTHILPTKINERNR